MPGTVSVNLDPNASGVHQPERPRANRESYGRVVTLPPAPGSASLFCLPADLWLHSIASMKRIFLSALALMTVCSLRAADDANINTLTDAEKAAGWKLLFNGKDFSGWHNFKREGVRPGWKIEDGALVCADPHNAGDIVSPEKYRLVRTATGLQYLGGGQQRHHVPRD